MAAGDARYDLQVFYAVTRADDIDILNEGLYAQDEYNSPADALGDLSRFIREHGGPDLWDEIDQYEIGTCWLPLGEDTEISYNARLDRLTAVEPRVGTLPGSERTPAMLTWGRLNAASFGGLRRGAAEQ